jgi:hypothetical protein
MLSNGTGGAAVACVGAAPSVFPLSAAGSAGAVEHAQRTQRKTSGGDVPRREAR